MHSSGERFALSCPLVGFLDGRRLVPHQALVDELELKLDQDERLVKEVGERFREECCEKQACQTDFAAMKKAIHERAALQQEMLQNRHRQHETLQRSNAASTLRLSQVSVCAYPCTYCNGGLRCACCSPLTPSPLHLCQPHVTCVDRYGSSTVDIPSRIVVVPISRASLI